MSPKDCLGSSGGKMPQNMKPDAHEARLSISPSVHVALQQIDSSQCIHCSSSPPVLTFSSGCYRSLEWTLHSICTPLESVDEREGRQKRERNTSARAMREKISTQIQPTLLLLWAGYQDQGWKWGGGWAQEENGLLTNVHLSKAKSHSPLWQNTQQLQHGQIATQRSTKGEHSNPLPGFHYPSLNTIRRERQKERKKERGKERKEKNVTLY